MNGCTALVVSSVPTRVCGRPFRGYDTAGQPRCGFHSRESRKAAKATSPASGEFQVEPEVIVCDLSCKSCGARSTIALAGDRSAKQTLAELSCPSCGRRGALIFCRSDKNPRTTP